MTRTPAVMEIELKPCPFCGVKAYAIDQIARQIVECGGCGVEMEGLDLEDAVRQWNHRTPAEPLADGEMIEIVARAIAAERHQLIGLPPPHWKGGEIWNKADAVLSPSERDRYRLEARAAIAAYFEALEMASRATITSSAR